MLSRIQVVSCIVPMLALPASAAHAFAQSHDSNVGPVAPCVLERTIPTELDDNARGTKSIAFTSYLRQGCRSGRQTSVIADVIRQRGGLRQGPLPYVPSRIRPPAPFFHGGHGAVSRALIDPTFTHHAILEDEVRINFFRFNRRASDARSVATLELAYAFSDAFGAEIFIPYVLDAIEVGGRSRRLLDVEIQPLKWSFLRRYNLVMTAVGAVVVPMERNGDGEHVWRFEPHLFVDAAVGPVAVQSNFIASFADNGEREIELATSIARMIFFESTKSAGPVLELLWEIPVAGEDGAQSEPFLAPGLKLQIGGWYFGGSYSSRSDLDRLSQRSWHGLPVTM